MSDEWLVKSQKLRPPLPAKTPGEGARQTRPSQTQGRATIFVLFTSNQSRRTNHQPQL